MAFLTGSGPKTALRILLLLILVGVGLSLFYAKEIRKVYEEWQIKGSSQESISIPSEPVLPENAAQTQGAGANSGPNYGVLPPDLNAQGGNQTDQPETDASRGEADPDLTGEGGMPGDPAADPLTGSLNASMNGSGDSSQDSAPTIVGGVEITTESGQQVLVGGVAPLQHQDSVITRAFVRDLAGFMVNSYYPPGSHDSAGQNGYVTASLLSLNMHYGQNANRYFGRSRTEVLRYVLSPSMLEALYRMHSADFLTAMQEIAQTQERQFKGGPRLMTGAEAAQMFNYYANYATSVAAVFEACTASPAIIERLDAYYLAAVDTYTQNQTYIAASIAHDQATPEEAAAARQTMNAAKAAYDRSFNQRENAREELLRSLKRYPGVRALADANILYSAGWINRRLADGSADTDTLAAVSRLLNSLAEQMRQRAKQ